MFSDANTISIVKTNPRPVDEFELRVLAYWMLYCLAPSKPEPDVDGKFDLGEIGETRLNEQRFLRETPYSICKGIRD